jgi:hypothetical protein
VYAITGPNRALPHAKDKVIVQERLNGSMPVFYRDRELNVVAVNLPPK